MVGGGESAQRFRSATVSHALYALAIRALGLCDVALQSIYTTGQSSSPGCYIMPLVVGVYVVVWAPASSGLHTSRSSPWFLSSWPT